jgi:hypothetical protein
MATSDIIIQVHPCMEALQVSFYYPATFLKRLATFQKHSGGFRICRRGVEGSVAHEARAKFLDATPTFGQNHDCFEKNFQPYQSNRSVFERS